MPQGISDKSGLQGGWPAQAQESLKAIRPAITNQLREPMVAPSMAPMMGELLTRLEGFSRPEDVGRLRPPESPPGVGVMSAAEASSALHDACGALRERAIGAGSGGGASAVNAMVEVIEDHLAMKGEVMARSVQNIRRG